MTTTNLYIYNAFSFIVFWKLYFRITLPTWRELNSHFIIVSDVSGLTTSRNAISLSLGKWHICKKKKFNFFWQEGWWNIGNFLKLCCSSSLLVTPHRWVEYFNVFYIDKLHVVFELIEDLALNMGLFPTLSASKHVCLTMPTRVYCLWIYCLLTLWEEREENGKDNQPQTGYIMPLEAAKGSQSQQRLEVPTMGKKRKFVCRKLILGEEVR